MTRSRLINCYYFAKTGQEIVAKRVIVANQSNDQIGQNRSWSDKNSLRVEIAS